MTVDELLHLHPLAGARLVAGAGGVRAAVRNVRLVDHLDQLPPVPAETALLITGDQGGWATEMALRFGWEHAASCVIVPADQDVLDATRRLADRLRVPLLAAPLTDPTATAIALSMAVAAPHVARVTVLADLATRVADLPHNPRPLLGLLNAQLPGTTVCLLAPDGAMLAGRAAAAERGASARDTQPTRHDASPGQLLVHPIAGADGNIVMRLVAYLSGRSAGWAGTVATALGIAAAPLSAWAASERLAAERDARLRGTLLTELLAGTDAASEHVASRVARLGWQLEGWHTGIYLALLSATDQETVVAHTPALSAELAAAGLDGVIVERADGWSVWIDQPEEPSPRAVRRFASRLRQLLIGRPAALALAGGVGPPGYALPGLRSSLALAREAALLAAAAGPGTVEHADDLGVRRLLLTPFGSEAFRSLADRLLAPLREGHNGTLLQALSGYLDAKCSATATAAELGVHRNTVMARVTRAAEILQADLGRPDERLAIQLACHAVRAGTDPSASG
jgi:PucR family transcriptional regulator, purine catabolism regulatory protein